MCSIRRFSVWVTLFEELQSRLNGVQVIKFNDNNNNNALIWLGQHITYIIFYNKKKTNQKL